MFRCNVTFDHWEKLEQLKLTSIMLIFGLTETVFVPPLFGLAGLMT